MNARSEDMQTLVGVLVLLVGLALVGLLEKPTEEDAEAARYCRMVAQYMDNPARGWPDYKDTFHRTCTPDGRLR
jgi:hypothetical protein